MINIKSRESAAFYRKVLLAYLIDSTDKVNAVVLTKMTGFPRRTIQNSLSDMEHISIVLKYHGSPNNGYYTVESWGIFDKEKVFESINDIRALLSAYLNSKG